VLVINGWLKSIEFVFRMNFYLVNQIWKLLYENSQKGFHEQFWRGNWQPGHTATIICTIKSYKMRNGNLSFSTWLRCASRIIRKCYIAMTNCLPCRCYSLSLSPISVGFITTTFHFCHRVASTVSSLRNEERISSDIHHHYNDTCAW
jgi:hypothetical protein